MPLSAYDECQNLESSIEKVQTGANTLTAYKTRYVYDRDDRIAATLFGEDADTTRTTLIYDSLGRIKTRKTYIGSCNSEESYTFAAGYTGYSANATTGLATGMNQAGMAQSYAYDVNGRITSWMCNNKVCSYEYDAIGQLIRVNDEKDPRGVSCTACLSAASQLYKTDLIQAYHAKGCRTLFRTTAPLFIAVILVTCLLRP